MTRTIEEARRIALEKRPGTRVESEHELSECFVINLVPVGYKESDGVFVGGSTRVDKKTGIDHYDYFTFFSRNVDAFHCLFNCLTCVSGRYYK